jgi:CMP-2-keto-3-deoxyoctulosonic acid synthetase
MKTACFIPIKANSERVPDKNLRVLNGKKLYEYICEHVKAANVFDDVPMDLNMNEIMFRVYRLYSVLGYPTERNESEFSTKMGQIVSQLEIYDQAWTVRDMEHAIQKGHPTVRHSKQGTALARKLIDYIETHDGCAECYPYDIIEELKSTFWLE